LINARPTVAPWCRKSFDRVFGASGLFVVLAC
jgi:hypothetical protein